MDLALQGLRCLAAVFLQFDLPIPLCANAHDSLVEARRIEGTAVSEKRETGEQDLFRSRLDQIINMKHELVRLAQAIDWPVLEERFGVVYSDGPGCRTAPRPTG